MVSEPNIVNDALTKIGNTAFIDSLDDRTTEAQVAKLHYERRRDEVLQSCDWPFAVMRAQLANLGIQRNGWRNAYALPVDCLKALAIPYPTMGTSGVTGSGVLADPMLFYSNPYVGIWTHYRNLRSDQRIPYRIERSDDGSSRILLCDYDAPELIYVSQVTDPNAFSPLFQNALAWRLAVEFAGGLKKDVKLMSFCMQAYAQAISEAMANAWREEREDREPESAIIAVRR